MLSQLKTYLLKEFLPLLCLLVISLPYLITLAFTFPLFLLFIFQWKWTVLLLGHYFLWIYYDNKTLMNGGRRVLWIRNLKLFNYTRDYFPLSLIKTAELTPGRNYILACYPHGYAATGLILNFIGNATNINGLFPGHEFIGCTVSAGFHFPIVREFLMAIGFISVSARNITTILTNKTQVIIGLTPGGVKEALLSKPGSKYTIVKRNRKGFVKLALKTGTSLVPGFTFGENNSTEVITIDSVLWNFIWNKIMSKITRGQIYFPKGRGFFQNRFGILPRRCPITTVVGAPIDVPKVENPSDSLIDEYHEKFHTALRDLFEKNKGLYDEAGENATLQTV